MNAITEKFSVSELVQRLNKAGVPCGSINTIKEAFEDPQVRHLGMAVPAPHEDIGDLNLVRSPINLSSFPHPASLSRAAPDTGADGEDILLGFGFAADEIAFLQKSGVIG